jgi:glutamate synthase (NADPH/NADH) large chain
MTGGVVYLKLEEAMGLDEEALTRRLAKGADVRIVPVEAADEAELRDLLSKYIAQLETNEQKQEIDYVRRLMKDWQDAFVKAVPKGK